MLLLLPVRLLLLQLLLVVARCLGVDALLAHSLLSSLLAVCLVERVHDPTRVGAATTRGEATWTLRVVVFDTEIELAHGVCLFVHLCYSCGDLQKYS